MLFLNFLIKSGINVIEAHYCVAIAEPTLLSKSLTWYNIINRKQNVSAMKAQSNS